MLAESEAEVKQQSESSTQMVYADAARDALPRLYMSAAGLPVVAMLWLLAAPPLCHDSAVFGGLFVGWMLGVRLTLASPACMLAALPLGSQKHSLCLLCWTDSRLVFVRQVCRVCRTDLLSVSPDRLGFWAIQCMPFVMWGFLSFEMVLRRCHSAFGGAMH